MASQKGKGKEPAAAQEFANMEEEEETHPQLLTTSSSVEEEEEQDEVVKVIDVYLTQEASNNLYLLQYPLRPTWRPYDRKNIEEVRFKAKSKKLEFDFGLTEEEIMTYYDTNQLDSGKKTFTLSSKVVPAQTNYVLGVLKSGTESKLCTLPPPLKLSSLVRSPFH